MIQQTLEKDKEEYEQNTPLKTEEIVSILNKSNNKNFLKTEKISSKISLGFKKLNVNHFAKKIEQDERNQKEDLNKTKNSKTPLEGNTPENFVIQNDDSNIETKEKLKNEEELLNQKKYTQEEADQMANELAKKYYKNGIRAGEYKIKKELENGEESIALALKNTIDNIFLISPEYLNKLNKNVNKIILSICNEVIGYHIEKLPEKFAEKIESLIESISETTNNAKLFLNEKDHSSIKNYFEKNKPKSNFSISVDNSLERGDLIIKSGGIEISNIVSKKIQLSDDADISEELNKIEAQNQNIAESNKAK